MSQLCHILVRLISKQLDEINIVILQFYAYFLGLCFCYSYQVGCSLVYSNKGYLPNQESLISYRFNICALKIGTH